MAEVEAGGTSGLGYTYADAAAAHFIHAVLPGLLVGKDAFAIPSFGSMTARFATSAPRDRRHRHLGPRHRAVGSQGALPGHPLVNLLGPRDAVPIYGSGGFTCYSRTTAEQLAGWVEMMAAAG